MRHKDTITKETAAPRRKERRRGLAIYTKARRERAKPRPLTKEVTDMLDSVYVVKWEKRSGDTGRPIIQEPSLAVYEGYRTIDKARAAMMDIARLTAALEISRAGHRPSPASLNVMPANDAKIDTIEVLTMDGMICRYFVDRMPIS